jgi:hypothetical protein
MGFTACGGSSSNSSSQPPTDQGTGTWSATLTTASNQQLGSFTFNMMQNNTSLSGSSMNFGNMGSLGSCFGAGTVMSGQMGPGMMNGGTMNMTMTWTPPGGTSTNTMTMKGNMASGMGSGSGTFTLTGQTPGCTSQSGNFNMSRTSSGMMMM